LLTEWRRCPGTTSDESFDADAFKQWLAEARKITRDTGHEDVALTQIGHVLTHALADPNGLWIHREAASAINGRDVGRMRSGFVVEVFNQRGVYHPSAGEAERQLAADYREKAEALESEGFSRFAGAIRSVADDYERQAEDDSRTDPFDG
jgi:hypothetical protein